MKSLAPKLALLLLLPAFFAHAADGGAGTGGGVGILCGKKLRTLDMYEGEQVRKLPLVQQPSAKGKASLEKDLGFYFLRYVVAQSGDAELQSAGPQAQALGVRKFTRQILRPFLKERVRFVDEDLPQTGDATLPSLEAGCRAVQIAAQSADRDPHLWPGEREKTFQIKINKKYWHMLDARQKAALIMHEVLYYLRRTDPSVVLSDDTRKSVIALFFEGSEPLYQDTWNPAVKHRSCNAQNRFTFRDGTTETMFGRFPTQWRMSETTRDGQKGLLFAFSQIDGEQLMSRTTMFVPGLDLATYGAGMHHPIQGVAKQDFDGREWDIKIAPAAYSFNNIDFNWLSVAAKAKDSQEFRREPVYGRCSSFDEDWNILQSRRKRAAEPAMATEPANEEATTNSAE